MKLKISLTAGTYILLIVIFLFQGREAHLQPHPPTTKNMYLKIIFNVRGYPQPIIKCIKRIKTFKFKVMAQWVMIREEMNISI